MKAQDRLNEIVERMIAKIENGETKSWIKPWNGTLPQNYSTKKEYRGFNVAMLWFVAEEQGYKRNSWLTFNQLKKMGAMVKKGEKATPIFFYKPCEFKEIDEQSGEEIVKTVPLLKSYNVFNLDQLDGIEEEANNHERVIEIEEFIINTGATVKTAQEAFYSPQEDYIGIPDISHFISEEHYYSTMLHELSHWSGHTTRLNRDLSGRFGDTSYSFEELCAESASALLGAGLGINSDKMRHEEYLESWITALKAEPKILYRVFSHAQKIYDYLMKLQKVQKAA